MGIVRHVCESLVAVVHCNRSTASASQVGIPFCALQEGFRSRDSQDQKGPLMSKQSCEKSRKRSESTEHRTYRMSWHCPSDRLNPVHKIDLLLTGSETDVMLAASKIFEGKAVLLTEVNDAA